MKVWFVPFPHSFCLFPSIIFLYVYINLIILIYMHQFFFYFFIFFLFFINSVPCWFCRYCMAGTVGHRLTSGKPTKVDTDPDTQIDVRCQVHFISYSFIYKEIYLLCKQFIRKISTSSSIYE